MKLTELEPQFVRATESGTQDVAALVEAEGVRFWCPACKGTDCHAVLVWFRDRGVPCMLVPGPGRWAVSGTGYHDLTLSPSVDLTRSRPSCWHGFVTNGEVACV